MMLDENWGIPMDRISDFFSTEPDVTAQDDIFLFGDCRITLTALPGHRLGPWEMPLTRVQMEGPDEDVQTIHRRFYLRFLSAGG